MKKAFILATVLLFSLSVFSIPVYSQNTLNTYIDLDESQKEENKKLQEQYASEKEDLETKLKMLSKDRDVAKRDKNTSLVERRNREIKETQNKLNSLQKEYNKDFSEILTDEQKEKANIDSDFYDKELKAEQEKMNAADKKAPAKKVSKPAPKKKAAPKKAAEPVAVSDEQAE